jgi:hypothetical protein
MIRFVHRHMVYDHRALDTYTYTELHITGILLAR